MCRHTGTLNGKASAQKWFSKEPLRYGVDISKTGSSVNKVFEHLSARLGHLGVPESKKPW